MNKLKPTDVNKKWVVIYHKPCNDGYGAAYCAMKYFKDNFPDLEVEYLGYKHGIPPPDVFDKNVLILDFSFRQHILTDMINNANNLLVIDHHESAEKDLITIDDKYKIFDMKHSGAYLAWKYFFPDRNVPLLIKYIEDRDIWAKKLPNSDDFDAWFKTLPFEFELYDKLIDEDLLKRMISTKGIFYREYIQYTIDDCLPYAVPKFMNIEDKQDGDKLYFVAYLNSSVHKSDFGNKIFDKLPFCDFSAVYSINDRDNSTYFSLRSTDKRANVSKIAFDKGGGGHRNASGIKVPYVANNIPGDILDNGKLYPLLEHIYFGEINFRDRKYNVVYLNSSYLKYELGKYLLQKRYEFKGKNIQNCIAIKEIIEKNNKEDNECYEFENIDVAAIYDYNGSNNLTYYSFSFDLNNDNKYFGELKDLLINSYTILKGFIPHIRIK